MRIKLPVLTNGGLILSYKCTNRCKHCLYASSPEWNDWYDINDLKTVIKSLSKYNFYGIHLAGGEPFLNFELLLKSVQLCKKYNVPMEYVETNCYWAVNEKETEKKFQELKKAGLPGVLISVSPFHNEFIPLKRVITAYKIAQKVFGYNNVLLYTDYYYSFLKHFDINKKFSFDQFVQVIGRRKVGINVKYNYGIILNGRAIIKLAEFFPHYNIYDVLTKSCKSRFLNPHHVHIDLYGNYITSFCAGISMGQGFDLTHLYEVGINLDEFPVLKILYNEGTAGLLKFVEREIGFEPLKNGYISECHLCNHLRYILIKYRFTYKELVPIEYYKEYLK